MTGGGDEAAALPEFGADVGAAGRDDTGDRLRVGRAVEALRGLQASVVMDQVDAVDGHGLYSRSGPGLFRDPQGDGGMSARRPVRHARALVMAELWPGSRVHRLTA